MSPLYDFRCNAAHRYEALRPVGTQTDVCACGRLAIKVYGYKTGGIRETGPDTRGMFRRYREVTEEAEDRGWSDPGLWKGSKERAKRFSRAGENPVVRS